MNPKIIELARQAGFTMDEYELFWDDNANTDGVDLEKFAELIIQQCAKIVDINYEPDGPRMTPETITDYFCTVYDRGDERI